MEISPKSERLGKLVAAERVDEAVTLGQLNDYGVTGATYKKYKAVLTQSGTNAPEAIVLDNSLGTLTWSYVGVGSYKVTCSGLFTLGKVFVLHGNQADLQTSYQIADANEIQFYTFSDIATPSNNMIFNLGILIEVYN